MTYPPGTTQFTHDEYEIEMDRLDGPSCSRCNDTGLIGTGRYHEREVCDCVESDEPDICPPTIVDEEPIKVGRTGSIVFVELEPTRIRGERSTEIQFNDYARIAYGENVTWYRKRVDARGLTTLVQVPEWSLKNEELERLYQARVNE